MQQWANNGWLRPHKTSPQEIQDLLAIVKRDLADATASELSADWQFGIAYNAARKLCTILMHASGFGVTIQPAYEWLLESTNEH
ncbi:MAG: hypothetical protein AB1813_24775 [Verrucomicrobiota bacterium]